MVILGVIMTCRHTQTLLEDFLDGDLDSADADLFSRHAEQCSECRIKLEEAKKLREQLKSHTVPDPGERYFEETTRLILSRTGSLNRDGLSRRISAPPSVPINDSYIDAKAAFIRSVVSFAMAVLVLVSAIYIGTNSPDSTATADQTGTGYYVSVDLSNLLNADREKIVTAAEQNRISRGMLLMGAPGALGRGPVLSQMLLPIE